MTCVPSGEKELSCLCFLLCTGEEKPYRSKSFNDFTQLCVLAYRILRRHANLLLLGLLAMMLPSGLPELTSLADLEYVRKTLALDAGSRGSASGDVGDDDGEKEAVNYFNAKFNEAYNGAWTTKIDWFAHWVRS